MEYIRHLFQLYIIVITAQSIGTLHPVIIFPGLCSNTIWHVPKPGDCFPFERLWYSAASTGLVNPCWADAMKLQYIASTNQVQDSTIIKFHFFGNLSAIEDIGEGKYLRLTELYKTMVNRLVEKGLRRDDSIRAVPMDWRRSVTDFSTEYYDNVFNELVAIKHRSKAKATLICHSYGCLNLANFISKYDPAELNVYIHKIITLGAPWRGSTKALKTLLSGDTLDIPGNLATRLQPVTSTFTSLVHLIPDADILADYNPFVTINFVSFKSIPDLLGKFGINPNITEGRSNISSLIYAFDRLGKNIEIHCLYGESSSSKVISKLDYLKVFGRWQLLTQTKGEGDGTVPLKSLEGCVNKTFITTWKKFDVTHQEMLWDERILNYIMHNID